jgi:putative ABC transport system permease protein
VSRTSSGALVIGIIGGIAGVALGYGGAALIQSLTPPLTASTGAASSGGPAAAAGPGGPGGGGGLAHAASAASHSVSVHLTAPVTLGAVGLAVALAILGGLIAARRLAGCPASSRRSAGPSRVISAE